MPTMQEVREKYPQYKDLPDDKLAQGLHQKYYKDMPADQFNEKIGFKPQPKTDYFPEQIKQWAADKPNTSVSEFFPIEWDTDKQGNRIDDSNRPAMPGFVRGAARGVADLLELKDDPEHPNITPDMVGVMLGGSPVGAGALKAAGKAAAPVASKALDATEKVIGLGQNKLKSPTIANPQTKAAEVIRERIERGEKAGGPNAAQILQDLGAQRAQGKPAVLADAKVPGLKGLTGYIARQPEGKDKASLFLEARDKASGDRLTEDVNNYLAKGSARKTSQALAEQRSKEAKPLYEEAYRGGSMAPLEQQYEKHFTEATKNVTETSKEVSGLMNKLTQLKAKQSTNKDIYVGADVQKEIRETEHAIAEAEGKLHIAHADKTAVLDHLRTAQSDRMNKTPGAIWNPRIERLLKNPEVRKGLNKGVQIERNNAAAEGRVFDPTELAIKGFDKEGNPIVGKVPNMKLLASAKEGLDHRIASDTSLRDPLTRRLNKEGVSVQKLRNALLKELDDNNDKYKAARDVWAGHSRSMESVKFGQDLFRTNPEEVAEEIGAMSRSEKEFAKLGAADMLREKIAKTGFHGDEAKSIIKSDYAQKQLRPLFDTQKDFDSFVHAVTSERNMFETGRKILGNSATAERLSEDDSSKAEMALKAGKGVMQAVTGSLPKALMTFFDAWRNTSTLRKSKELNDAIAQLLFDPALNLEKLGVKPVVPAKP